MTKNYLKALVLNLENIKSSVVNYIDLVEHQKHVMRFNSHSCNVDEVTFDVYAGTIVWTYEYNSACHCHPEMHTHTETYKIEDFLKYLNEKNIEIEQHTEAEIAEW